MISGAAVDVILVYQAPIMIAAGLPLGLAATIGGIRGFAQVGGRLCLSPLLSRLGALTTIIVTLGVALVGVLLLLASHDVPLAFGYSLLAGASLGALSTLQGIYTNELVGDENLSLLMGAQQAVFAIGIALGPVIAGAVFAASHTYTPVVILAGAGFLTSAPLLSGPAAHGRWLSLSCT